MVRPLPGLHRAAGFLPAAEMGRPRAVARHRRRSPCLRLLDPPPPFGQNFQGISMSWTHLWERVWSAFALASIARILYPIMCLACDRLWPW